MSAGSEILLQAKDNRLKVEEVEIHCRYDVERGSTEQSGEPRGQGAADAAAGYGAAPSAVLLHPAWNGLSGGWNRDEGLSCCGYFIMAGS